MCEPLPPPLDPPRLVARRRRSAVHSAPAYVVGTQTSGRPVAAETALPRSIALPPPSASEPVAAAASRAAPSSRSSAPATQTPCSGETGRSRSPQRRLATSSGRSDADVDEDAAELVQPPADDHAVRAAPANARNASARAASARRPVARTSRSRAPARAPRRAPRPACPPRARASTDGREMKVTP